MRELTMDELGFVSGGFGVQPALLDVRGSTPAQIEANSPANLDNYEYYLTSTTEMKDGGEVITIKLHYRDDYPPGVSRLVTSYTSTTHVGGAIGVTGAWMATAKHPWVVGAGIFARAIGSTIAFGGVIATGNSSGIPIPVYQVHGPLAAFGGPL